MVVSQFFSPLRTLKNKARGTKLATTSSSPSTTTAGRNSDSSSDSDTPPATPMSTDTCLCCNSKVTFPATVSCFKCTVCDTINDLQPVRRTEKTVTDNREVRVRMREAPPPLTLDRLRAGVQAYRRDLAKQALLEAMLRESFGNWDVLNFSFVKANADEPDAAEVCLEEVAAAYRIILDLPSGLIRAMMTGIELILRRPERPLKTFSDIRYLL
ncbi:putative E3 ubiquitin-protein ligase, partial [Kickxella alabastrina]